jgi:hypothetical protein
MAFFDLFWGSRSRCAPNPSRKRVVCSVEVLESRLVPSAVSSSYPVGPVAVPPAATPYQVNTTAGALTQNALVVLAVQRYACRKTQGTKDLRQTATLAELP